MARFERKTAARPSSREMKAAPHFPDSWGGGGRHGGLSAENARRKRDEAIDPIIVHLIIPGPLTAMAGRRGLALSGFAGLWQRPNGRIVIGKMAREIPSRRQFARRSLAGASTGNRSLLASSTIFLDQLKGRRPFAGVPEFSQTVGLDRRPTFRANSPRRPGISYRAGGRQ